MHGNIPPGFKDHVSLLPPLACTLMHDLWLAFCLVRKNSFWNMSMHLYRSCSPHAPLSVLLKGYVMLIPVLSPVPCIAVASLAGLTGSLPHLL